MTKTITLALALVAGLLGGLLTRYMAPPAAFAQNQPSITKEIRAQSFALVDASNRLVGTFTIEPLPSTFSFRQNPQSPNNLFVTDTVVPAYMVVVRDSSGHKIWSAGGSMIQPLNQR